MNVGLFISNKVLTTGYRHSGMMSRKLPIPLIVPSLEFDESLGCGLMKLSTALGETQLEKQGKDLPSLVAADFFVHFAFFFGGSCEPPYNMGQCIVLPS